MVIGGLGGVGFEIVKWFLVCGVGYIVVIG